MVSGQAGWCIFYADGSTVTSEDCAPQDVPGFGVQAIAQPDPTNGTGNVGYVVLSGHEWYYWHTEAQEWLMAENDRSLLDLKRLRRPIVGESSGERIPRARYERILALAGEWAETQELPRKSGHHWGEYVE